MSEASPEIASVLSVLGTRRDDLRIAQELIEVLPIPVFFKGRDGKYLGVNRAWEAFFGVKRADIIGGRVNDLYPNAPGVAARHREMDEQLWNRPGDQSYEIRLPFPDGRVRHTITTRRRTPARTARSGASSAPSWTSPSASRPSSARRSSTPCSATSAAKNRWARRFAESCV
jgi:PAS domain S-box-containing protein